MDSTRQQAAVPEPARSIDGNAPTVSAISEPTTTRATPGAAMARLMSMASITACALVERTIAIYNVRGTEISATNRAWPKRRRASSRRGTGVPTRRAAAISVISPICDRAQCFNNVGVAGAAAQMALEHIGDVPLLRGRVVA